MPRAVKYILLPFAEYDTLLNLKKKTQSTDNAVAEANPLNSKVIDILNRSGLTDYEKITTISSILLLFYTQD